ncbi:MAG TPA: glycosyltransferase family A protein [Acidimicrobiia bacterium]|jgi:hypothetical protein
MTRLRVLVHVSPFGNLYMREVADLLCRGFDDLGVANAIVEHELPRDQPGVCNLVVAPHEFFTLYPNVSEVQTLEAAACSVLLNTEQPETTWFGIVLRYLRVARAVFDMNSFAVHQLVERDVQAHLLLLGYHPSWDRWGGDDSVLRHLDAVYMGSLTERRSEALARVAPVLAGRRTRFLIHDGRVPVTHDGDGYVTGDEKHDLLAHTRLLLNVHRSKVPYFEWHRNMPAITNGCLVVTEPGESHDPLVPWEHFAVAPSDSFPEFVEMLLASPDVVRRLVHQGYDFVRHELRLTDQLRMLLPVCEDAAMTGPPTRRMIHYIASTGSQLVEEQGPLPAPNHLVAASTPAERVLKRSLMHQKKLARKIDELECHAATGTDQHEEIVDNAAWHEARPEISIVIPVYNYERYVTQALASAAGSRGVDVELVVIDDHSTDGSRAVVEKFQNDRPEVALRIVSLSVNTGLSAVRNRALDHVRADYVFFLDADNSVYPDALRTLHDALRDADGSTAFAYGMIRCFGEQDRLLSVYPWSIERLVRGNYIDAMVMMRRRVLDELGGFSLEMQNEHGGWEDYEMWLRLASQGLRAEFVPEIIGSYRVHGTSMVATVNLDAQLACEHLRGQYASLPWPELELVSVDPRYRVPEDLS